MTGTIFIIKRAMMKTRAELEEFLLKVDAILDGHFDVVENAPNIRRQYLDANREKSQ